MLSNRHIDQLKNSVLEIYNTRLNQFLSLCESQIEKIFLLNFIAYFEDQYSFDQKITYEYDFPDISPNGKGAIKGSPIFRDGIFIGSPYCITVDWKGLKGKLIPKYQISTDTGIYTIDFFLEIKRFDHSILNLCIFCYANDNYKDFFVKDRELQTNGYLIMRYNEIELISNSGTKKFKRLMVQIEKLATYDLVKNEKEEIEIFINEFILENNYDEKEARELRKLFDLE